MIPELLPREARIVAGSLCVPGVDPGPTTGILIAVWHPGIRRAVLVRAFECNLAAAPPLLDMLLSACGAAARRGGIEQFRSGPRSQRLRGTRADDTRTLADQLCALAWERCPLTARPAALVKPWATDERLDRAGLLEPTAGLRDARDAARHALYTAVHDCNLADPLSRKASA